ncbi:MAG: T9SS type A sorting domain-containing protein [Breznakibacter sp.]
MNKFFFGILLGLFFYPIECFSQSSTTKEVSFSYDMSGNRINRKVIYLSAKGASISDNHFDFEAESICEDSFAGLKILVYPNPTKGLLHVDINGAMYSQNGFLTVHGLGGTTLFRVNSLLQSNLIDLSSYKSGVYILRLTLNTESKEWKIIKE